MTAPTPEELRTISSELLLSLHESLRRARKLSEEFLLQFETEEEINPDTSRLKPQIAKLDGLIRDIQKVEKTLVSYEHAPGAPAWWPSTSVPPEMRSSAAWLACVPPFMTQIFLAELDEAGNPPPILRGCGSRIFSAG
ncbi:hypothetical protein [Phaeobacter sp. HF9A]|uniref:hypothetical protein n=1 Tax=Phaeobacter sp. HF9A TaxID=2721561 RepID=UPI0020CA8628|nr:hypothetical protein [Phaeobacter sp. HF9A]